MSSSSQPSPERRTDLLTGRQVIVSTSRSARPNHLRRPASTDSAADEAYDPFLEGNEHDTPGEVMALRRTDSTANDVGWLLRVVPNRYPAVEASLDTISHQTSDSLLQPASGHHEVVIECPARSHRLVDFSVMEVARLLSAWQRRITRLSLLENVATINVFRNEGGMAGASLPHCHSQILATDTVHRSLEDRIRHNEILTDGHADGLCSYQQWMQHELLDAKRVVQSDDQFSIVCPFASRVSSQVRFCPTHEACLSATPFADLNQQQITDLASRLLSVVTALTELLGDFSFNLLLSLPPVDRPQAFPWMLDLMPRASQFAGFELLTDTEIITTAPEAAATALRETVVWQVPPPVDEPVWPDNVSWV